MLHLIKAQSQAWREILWNESKNKRRRNDHLNCVCLVSGGGALWITNQTSRHGQQQCDTDTFLLSTTYLLIPPAFPRCSVHCLGFEILFFLWFCAVSCLILHFSDLFSSLSRTALYCSVVLSSIKQGEHVIVLTTHPLCATAPEALSQQRILEEYEHRAKGKDKWIFNKQKQAGWLTEKCGFYDTENQTPVCCSPSKHRPEEVLVQNHHWSLDSCIVL